MGVTHVTFSVDKSKQRKRSRQFETFAAFLNGPQSCNSVIRLTGMYRTTVARHIMALRESGAISVLEEARPLGKGKGQTSAVYCIQTAERELLLECVVTLRRAPSTPETEALIARGMAVLFPKNLE